MKWDKATVVRGLIVVILVGLYVMVLYVRRYETGFRLMRLQETSLSADYVKVAIRIISVNTDTDEITARFDFQPVGRFAKDEVTPTVNLKVLLNSVKGAQELEFSRGKRMHPVDAVFSTAGNQSDYPFDHHQTALWLLLTTPARLQSPEAPLPSKARKGGKKVPAPAESAFGTAVLQENDSVPVVVDLTASVSGFRFTGNIRRNETREVTGIHLNFTRSYSVKTLSIAVMTMMSALAWSVFVMTLRVTRPERMLDLVPLSLAMSLLFGLPALRSIQPNVPPIGALGDYLSFIWAELVVAFSAVVIIWTWILRSWGISRAAPKV
jgi:hypothetical protein